MKTIGVTMRWAVEGGILVGLIRGFFRFFAERGQPPEVQALLLLVWLTIITLLYIPIAAVVWRRVHKRLAPQRTLELTLLAGPSLLLSLVLAAGMSIQLTSGQTKELMSESRLQGVSEESFDLWWSDRTSKLAAERWLYVMLAASLSIHYCDQIGRETKGGHLTTWSPKR